MAKTIIKLEILQTIKFRILEDYLRSRIKIDHIFTKESRIGD